MGHVSWEGLPFDHAYLVVPLYHCVPTATLNATAPPTPSAPVPYPAVPFRRVTSLHIGHRVLGNWCIQLWAFKLLHLLLTLCDTSLDMCVASVGLLFVDYSTYISFLLAVQLFSK